MTGYDVKPLDETTWPDFADLVERSGGVWGGCWCMGFHVRACPTPRSRARSTSSLVWEAGWSRATARTRRRDPRPDLAPRPAKCFRLRSPWPHTY